jgi:hypothetical protein
MAVLITLLAVLLFATGLPRSVASDLVIAKDGSNEYHQPGCELIRNGKGLLALTVAQASGRGLRPHPECHNPPTRTGARAAPAPVPVYVDGSRYYHRKECSKLVGKPNRIELEEAGRKYWPCPTCKPPIRKRKGG